MLILTLTRTLPQMSVSNLAAHGKFIAADTIIIVSKKLWIKKNLYFCQNKTQKIPNDEKIIILLRISTRALHRLQEPALARGVCYRL